MLSELPEEAYTRLKGQKIHTAKNIDDNSRHILQDGCAVDFVMRIIDITNEINRPGPS
jgi:hypothetical protein